VLQKQVADLKLHLKTYAQELVEASELKNENKQYKNLILKYEEQSRHRESEYESMQDQIKSKIKDLEESNNTL
jgi:hypothetical protein